MLRIAKIVVIYKNNIEENINRFSCCSEYTYCLHLLPWVAKVQPFLLFCAGVGRGESGGMQFLLFFQDNAACFPFIRHEILCSLCFFIFTIPIINSKIATLATNDMWPYSQFSMSGLAGLRAAAFIYTFTHWESKWGEGVVICSWDIRDLWPATHQISIIFYYRK